MDKQLPVVMGGGDAGESIVEASPVGQLQSPVYTIDHFAPRAQLEDVKTLVAAPSELRASIVKGISGKLAPQLDLSKTPDPEFRNAVHEVADTLIPQPLDAVPGEMLLREGLSGIGAGMGAVVKSKSAKEIVAEIQRKMGTGEAMNAAEALAIRKAGLTKEVPIAESAFRVVKKNP